MHPFKFKSGGGATHGLPSRLLHHRSREAQYECPSLHVMGVILTFACCNLSNRQAEYVF